MPDTGDELMAWADKAMFEAEPSDITPRATVISMTPDPLRVMAAACLMYQGKTVRDPDDVTSETALRVLRDMETTTLNAGLEFIDVHLLLEGVTRGFTHQLVRQRTAVYVQESTRFAVKRGAGSEVAPPPSIAALPEDDPRRLTWDSTVDQIGWAYNSLIGSGVPAEDARGLLPTNITTRIHYKTNLRNLVTESGKRLCSQAQFEWKQVWIEIVQAIQNYPRAHPSRGDAGEQWQYDAIVKLFKPVCYITGKCEFMASTDRACVIRDRVEAHHRKGEPPDTWSDINQYEPLREGAARQQRSPSQ